MKNRLAKTLLATAAIAAFAAPVGAQARQGADDPAGHVRHASHQTTARSSSAGEHRSRTRDRHRHRHGGRHHRNDDRLAGPRRGGGTDDGPNHT
jgi:Ni/Co efflux regulator RcnB